MMVGSMPLSVFIAGICLITLVIGDSSSGSFGDSDSNSAEDQQPNPGFGIARYPNRGRQTGNARLLSEFLSAVDQVDQGASESDSLSNSDSSEEATSFGALDARYPNGDSLGGNGGQWRNSLSAIDQVDQESSDSDSLSNSESSEEAAGFGAINARYPVDGNQGANPGLRRSSLSAVGQDEDTSESDGLSDSDSYENNGGLGNLNAGNINHRQ